MTVTDYFGQTAYAGRISELAINEALRDRIVADGGTPVRDGAQLQAQDTFPRLLEQAMSLMAGKGNGWAANARAVTATGAVAIAAATDDGMFVDVNANGASRAVNLPDAANLRQGWNCVIRKSDGATADVLTLTPDAGDTITGPTTLTDQFSALFVCRTGATTWATMKIVESQVGLGWASNARQVAAVGPVAVNASDDGLYIGVDPGGADRVVNLPSAAGLRQGWNCVIRKDALPGDAFTLTLTPNGGDSVSGPAVIASTHDAIMLVRVGAASWATIEIASSAAANVQVFAAPGAGVWTKPAGASAVTVIAYGAGGGGGGGCNGNTPTDGCGGAGGGGGARAEKTFRAADLGATENVSVGAGGAGGAGAASGVTANGVDGSGGGASTFGTTVLLFAGGGAGGYRGAFGAGANPGGGGGGTGTSSPAPVAASTRAGGEPGSHTTAGRSISGGGGGSSRTGLEDINRNAEDGGAGGGGYTNWTDPSAGGSSIYGGGGGGAGGGISGGANATAGKAGGGGGAFDPVGAPTGGAGGAAGIPGAGAPGTAGAAGSSRHGGSGGGGGGGGDDGQGGAGGAGGAFGGGGGGGGAGQDNNGGGGVGGDGGDGAVIVISW